MSDEDTWQPATATVTAQLLVGPPPPDAGAIAVADTESAVQVIQDGRTAVLPALHWDVASAVLETLGHSKQERVLLLLHAQTGQSIPADRLNPDELDAALRGVSHRGGQSGILCTGCGYVEPDDPQTKLEDQDRFLPFACPVCHGEGFD